MKLKFNIVSIYSPTQIITKMIKEGWSYMYNNLEGIHPYVLTDFQPKQIMKAGRYGKQLKKL